MTSYIVREPRMTPVLFLARENIFYSRLLSFVQIFNYDFIACTLILPTFQLQAQ